VLGFFLGVEVVEVAEELVEPVIGGQEFVFVTKVVLTELPGRVAQGFEQLRDSWVFGPQPQVCAGHANLGKPGSQRILARDERGAS